MKHLYTISFDILAGITIEAESEDEAVSLFDNDPNVRQDIMYEIAHGNLEITDIVDEGEADE